MATALAPPAVSAATFFYSFLLYLIEATAMSNYSAAIQFLAEFLRVLGLVTKSGT